MHESLPFRDSTQQVWPGCGKPRPEQARSSLGLGPAKSGPSRPEQAGSYPSPPMSGSPPPPRHLASPYGEQEPGHRACSTGEHRRRSEEAASLRTWQLQQAGVPSYPVTGSASSLDVLTRPYSDSQYEQPQYYHGAYRAGPASSHQTPPVNPSPPSSTRTPRRTKAHVPSACVNCKKAHLACDVERPCRRCVGTGREDSCVDVQHKKRGRPRLRNERELSQDALGIGPTPQTHIERHLSFIPPRRSSFHPLPAPQAHRPGSFRVLKAQARGGSRVKARHLGHASLADAYVTQGSTRDAAVAAEGRRRSSPNLAHAESDPVVFMRMDLAITSFNDAFHHVMGIDTSTVIGRPLFDLVDRSEDGKLHRLMQDLKDERLGRDPHYLPPIYDQGEAGSVSETTKGDLARMTHGFTRRPMTIRFRCQGQALDFTAHFSLAKRSAYFVVLALELDDTHRAGLPRHLSSAAGPAEYLSYERARSRSCSGPPIPTAPRLPDPSSTGVPFPTQAGGPLASTQRDRADPRIASCHPGGEPHQSGTSFLSYRSAPSTPPASEGIVSSLSSGVMAPGASTPPHLREFQLAPIRDIPAASDETSFTERRSSTSTRQSEEEAESSRQPKRRERVSVREMLE